MQPLRELLQRADGTLLRGLVQFTIRRQSCRQAYRFAQRIHSVDLFVDNAADLQPERIGAEINCSNGGKILHSLSRAGMR